MDNDKITYAIIGAGGHGREVMPLIAAKLRQEIIEDRVELIFAVENALQITMTNGYKVMPLDKFLNLANPKKFNVAIGNSKVRERISSRCFDNKIIPFSIIAENSLVLDESQIGDGYMISPFTTITSNVKIGRFFHANNYCNIAHDCIIGDYVTFAPGVRCNGNVQVHDHAYIGSGAIIKQGRSDKPTVIGKGAVVGMGAVVTKDVLPYTTVVGNPARLLMK